ncbi:MAG TPA: HNH endonuclease [Chthoniobacterales bacterium]|jgi:hypothetical protein|nr:HNH endonuclease [Chthoniobacterales bacterium]
MSVSRARIYANIDQLKFGLGMRTESGTESGGTVDILRWKRRVTKSKGPQNEYATISQSPETVTEQSKREFWQLVVEKGTTKCWSWIGQYDADGRPVFRGEKAYRAMYELWFGREVPPDFHVHHKCETSSCVNPRHLVALSPEDHRAVHSTKDKAIQEQIYLGEWEQVKVAKAEEARLEKARLERERLEAVQLEEERLERERLQRCRAQERLAQSERQRIASLDAENRRISRLRRENLIVKLRKICLYGGPGLVFALLLFSRLIFQWFPTYDRWVEDGLILLAFIAFGFSLIAIEGQLKNPISGLKIPRWQLTEIAKHRRLRRKTEATKIVWTRTFERVAVTEFRYHWARVAVGVDGKFAFFVYSKDSGGIACSWYGYGTEQKAMHTAVDFMQEGKEPVGDPDFSAM